MKISGKQLPNGLLAGLGPLGESRRADAIEAPPAPEGPYRDQVVLSPAAREVQEALRQVRSVPDVRSEMVAALKELVRSNAYPVDVGSIARKMLTEHLVNQAL